MSIREDMARLTTSFSSVGVVINDWKKLLDKVDVLEQDALRYRALVQVSKNAGCDRCDANQLCEELDTEDEICIQSNLNEEQLDKLVAYYKEKGIL